MKSSIPVVVAAVVLVLLGVFVGRQMRPVQYVYEWPSYDDGTYRGVFIDGADIQVNVQFVLEDDVVTEAEFRRLWRDEDYHLDANQEPYQSVITQYQESLDYLVGKDIRTHLADLYHPENIVTTQVNGYTAATLRSNKIISAIRDALNRGVYSY